MWQVIETYIPLVAAFVAQVVLVLLPVKFCNWRDDWLWVLTYAGFQLLTGALLLVVLLSSGVLVGLGDEILPAGLVITFGLVVVRVVRLIPLEGTSVTSVAPQAQVKVDFSAFYLEAEEHLGNGSFSGQSNEARRLILHERLVRRRPDKADHSSGRAAE